MPLTIQDMASIGFPLGAKDGRLLMLKMFIDDTGTDKRSSVVGAGALIGTEEQWEKFDVAWRALLANPFPDKPPLTKWSSGDCRWGQNEFRDYNEAERDNITYRFRKIITESGVSSSANVIDKIPWDRLITARFGDKMASAEATALFAVIDRLAKYVINHTNGPKVAIYYDVGRKSEPDVKNLAALLSDAMTTLSHVASFSFLRVVDATPLQGADMVATEAFWHAQYVLGRAGDKPRAHFLHYLSENFGHGNGMILDEEGIKRDLTRRNADGTLRYVWEGQSS